MLSISEHLPRFHLSEYAGGAIALGWLIIMRLLVWCCEWRAARKKEEVSK